MRTFKRIQKQVDQRVNHRRPRGNVHVLVHELLVYLLEVKTFHVKHYEYGRSLGVELTEFDKDLLSAGEQLEERTKQWLTGDV